MNAAHKVRSADFGPTWPEVAGFGEDTPQQAIFEFSHKGKSQKCASVNTLALLAPLIEERMLPFIELKPPRLKSERFFFPICYITRPLLGALNNPVPLSLV